MFFAQLKSTQNPNHPSNSSKNVVRKKEQPDLPKSPGKVVKQHQRTKSRSGTPKAPRTPKSPVSHVSKDPESPSSRGPSVTPEPVEDTNRQLFKRPDHDAQVINSAELTDLKTHIDIFEEENVFTLELPFGQEKYRSCQPKREDYDDNVMYEAEQVMTTVGRLCNKEQVIKDENMRDCIVRRMNKSIEAKDKQGFTNAVEEYNSLVRQHRDDGTFEQTIKNMNRPDFNTVSDLLNQVYARVVSPRANELRHYKAFSNNVYGELLPKFTSKVFKETGITSNSVFMDLGSGVGNCVLQAALEVGCESIGCEMMDTACDLAARQQIEFENRTAMYGMDIGKITLKNNDFTVDRDVANKLSQVDLLLVNNYAFDAELTGSLVNMFLDLKEGCKIVSLKSFVPKDHVITAHNVHSPFNILTVQRKHFGLGSVSWTEAGGVYYIATVDRSRIAKFM